MTLGHSSCKVTRCFLRKFLAYLHTVAWELCPQKPHCHVLRTKIEGRTTLRKKVKHPENVGMDFSKESWQQIFKGNLKIAQDEILVLNLQNHNHEILLSPQSVMQSSSRSVYRIPVQTWLLQKISVYRWLGGCHVMSRHLWPWQVFFYYCVKIPVKGSKEKCLRMG
jgi:hypothetical protein